MRKYLFLVLLLLAGLANTFAQTVSYTQNMENTVFDNPTTFNSKTSYYRIPAITKDKDGNIIAIADVRIGGPYDIGGYWASGATTVTSINPITIVAKKSSDNGKNWGNQTDIIASDASSSGFDYAHGDAAVVTDSESGKMLLLCAGGKTPYTSAGCLIGQYTSDNGSTWTGGEITTAINTATTNAGLGSLSHFFTSGRIIQSSKVKVGDYYRVYSAMCSSAGSVVMYSDDFGSNWYVLGNQSAYSGGNETVLEELPNGDLLLSARLNSGNGRAFNVFRYSNLTTGTGSWQTAVTSTSLSDAANANGEMLLLPTSNSNYSILLHSLALSGRQNVTVYYKLINTASDDYKSPSFYSTGWTSLKQMSTTTSCYSTMIACNDGSVAYLMEENKTAAGVSDAETYDIQYRNFSVSASDLPSSSDYAITYSTPVGGTVSAGTSAATGATVTLSNTPNSGYELDKYIVTDATGATVAVTNGTFTMPSNAVTVSATFKVSSDAPTYIVNSDNGTFGHGSCSSTSSSYPCIWTSTKNDPTLSLQCVYDGTTTLINNMYDNADGTFKAYSANSNSSTYTAEYDLSVPEGYKIVSYSFDYVQASGTSLTVYDNDGNAYTSGNTVTVNAQTAKFSITGASATINYETISNFIVLIAPVSQYTITCNSSTGGTVSATSPAYEGSTVTMTVTPETGYELNALTVTDGSGNEVTVTDNTFTMPSSDVTVTATWKKVTTYTYTVSTSTGSPTGTSGTYYSTWTSTSSPTLTMKSYSDSGCSTTAYDITSSCGFYVAKATKSQGMGGSTTNGVSYFQLSVPTGYNIVSYCITYENSSTKTTVSVTSGGVNNVNAQTASFNVSNSSTRSATISTSNFTVTVKPIEYAITYNLNGGTNSVDNPSTYTIEDEVTLAAPTKTGYTFTGWTDSEGNAVTSIAEGSTGAITLTANWEIKEYTISYNLDDGTNADTNPATYTVETDDITLAEPTKQGYIFQGWTYGSQLTPTKTVTIAKGTTGDLTYTANWESKYTPDPANHNVTIKAIVGTVTDTEVSEALSALGTSKTDNTLVYDETGTYSGSTSNVVVKNGDTYTCENLVLADSKTASFNTTTAFTASTVTYTRPNSPGKWATIYLPYAPVKKEGYTYYVLSGADLDNGKLTFTSVDGDLAANTPYLIKNTTGENIDESTSSVDIVATPATSGDATTLENWSMKGVYERTSIFASSGHTKYTDGSITNTKTVDASSYYIKADGSAFAKVNGYFNLSAFRGYFSAGTSGNAKSTLLTFSTEDTPTAIKMVEKNDGTVDMIFDLSGRKLNNTQKGNINIINGKKIIVK